MEILHQRQQICVKKVKREVRHAQYNLRITLAVAIPPRMKVKSMSKAVENVATRSITKTYETNVKAKEKTVITAKYCRAFLYLPRPAIVNDVSVVSNIWLQA